MSRIWRILVTLGLAASLVLPAGPASAHVRLPVGKYACYEYDYNGQLWYTYKDLHIRTERRYAFKSGTTTIGSGGRFRHPADTNKIVFTSGFLYAKNYRGTHGASNGDFSFTLKKYTNGAWAVYYCGK